MAKRKLTTIAEVESEIARVKGAIAKTKSKYLRNDLHKYLKRLYSRCKQLKFFTQIDNLLEKLDQ